jgi:hypothetical protein
MYDELEEMKRGKYETEKEQVVVNEDNRAGAARPSSKRVQLSLFGVWNGASG